MKKILTILFLLLVVSINAQIIITGDAGASSISTDNQEITDFSINGNILSITIENGNTATVDLTSIVGNVTIDNFFVNGTNLTLELSNGSTSTVSLAGIGGSTSITAGTNVSITGDGTSGNPYIINATGGGGGQSITTKDEGVTLTTGTTEYNFTGAGVTASNTDGAVTVNVPGGAVSGNNPNIVIAETLADITSAGEGATIDIIEPIVLTGNYTPPANQNWIFSTGSIDLATHTLTGNSTSWKGNSDRIVFNAFSGILTGTWKPPYTIHSTQFGFKNDGRMFNRRGSISNGSTTLTVTGGDFTSSDVGNFISIYSAHSGFLLYPGSIDVPDRQSMNSHITTIASVINSTTVTITDPATAAATNVDVWTGSDNFNAGRQLIYMRNQYSGNLVFDPGMYFRRRVDEPITQAPGTEQTTWTIGMGTDDIKVYAYGATIAEIPHNVATGYLIKFWDTHRYEWHGGILHGEYKMHQWSGGASGGDEQVHGMVPSTLAIDGMITNVDLIGFTGDGIKGEGSTQFTNYIKGDNIGGSRESYFEPGGINAVTGVPEVNAKMARTAIALDVTKSQFQNTRLVAPTRNGRRIYQFSGSSFAGWEGLKTPRYWAFYYDANDNFLISTRDQEFYGRYELPEGVAKVHLVIEMPYDLDQIDTQLRAPVISQGLTLVNVNTYNNGRHGGANLPSKTTWRDSKIGYIGQTLPARGINIEDSRRSARDYHFENLTFSNCFGGGISLIGPVNVTITDCKFEDATYPGKSQDPNYVRAIGAERGRNVIISNNIIKGTVTMGRSGMFVNNKASDGYLSSEALGVIVRDNQFHNFTIRDAAYSATTDREPNWMEGNIFTFDKVLSDLFWDRKRMWKMKGNDVVFNYKGRLSSEVTKDSTYAEITLGSGGTNGNGLWRDLAISNDFNQPIYDLSIRGARPSYSARDTQGSRMQLANTYGLNVGTSIFYENGSEQDYELNDLDISGWVQFDLDEWSGTLSNPPTITMNRPYIHVDQEFFPWTNTGSNVLTTPAKNMSLKVVDGLFELNAAATVTGSSNKFMDLDHLGPSTFINTIFRSTVNTSLPLNLTNTLIFSSNLGAVTFIDCDFQGINLTLRSQDKRLFTKPHADLEVYADNTAALAGGIPAGYLYRTSDGTVKTVFNE